MPPFLTELHVRGYGCLKDVKWRNLTALSALIGPNDSGKSTLLRLVAGIANSDVKPAERAFAKFGDGSDLRFNQSPTAPGWHMTAGGNPQIVPVADVQAGDRRRDAMAWRAAAQSATAYLVRLNADELRAQSRLVPHGGPLRLEGRGRNLAALYDAVRDRSNERFTAISKETSALFPNVRELGLRLVADGVKVLTVTLRDGQEVTSDVMSEGLLYYLAFAILGELQRPDVYLVEEPENGLHPARIREVVRVLRAITEGPNGVQVILATHSPLVVNELQPAEVTVVTRDPTRGTHLHPIETGTDFEARNKVYALGELWLSYADGVEERPLLGTSGE